MQLLEFNTLQQKTMTLSKSKDQDYTLSSQHLKLEERKVMFHDILMFG